MVTTWCTVGQDGDPSVLSEEGCVCVCVTLLLLSGPGPLRTLSLPPAIPHPSGAGLGHRLWSQLQPYESWVLVARGFLSWRLSSAI